MRFRNLSDSRIIAAFRPIAIALALIGMMFVVSTARASRVSPAACGSGSGCEGPCFESYTEENSQCNANKSSCTVECNAEYNSCASQCGGDTNCVSECESERTFCNNSCDQDFSNCVATARNDYDCCLYYCQTCVQLCP